MQEDARIQQVVQKLGETLDEVTQAIPARPTVPLNGPTPREKPVSAADQHELEVAACVTQAWVRELIAKERQLDIRAEDVRCLWHALKAIGLVAGR